MTQTKEEKAAKAKIYRASHKQEAVAYAKEYRRNNKEKANNTVKQWSIKNPAASLITGARWRAKKDGIFFDLVSDDIVFPEFCPALGIPLLRGVNGFTDNSPTLDRIDPTKGYTKDNVRVISYRANRIKNNANTDELLLVVEYMIRETKR